MKTTARLRPAGAGAAVAGVERLDHLGVGCTNPIRGRRGSRGTEATGSQWPSMPRDEPRGHTGGSGCLGNATRPPGRPAAHGRSTAPALRGDRELRQRHTSPAFGRLPPCAWQGTRLPPTRCLTIRPGSTPDHRPAPDGSHGTRSCVAGELPTQEPPSEEAGARRVAEPGRQAARTRQEARDVGAQEDGPGEPRPLRRRRDAAPPQRHPDRRG